MKLIRRVAAFFARIGYLGRAAAWATLLGVIEMVTSRRGRRVLALGALAAVGVGLVAANPIRLVTEGEVAVRRNLWSGGVCTVVDGHAIVLPGVHSFRRYPVTERSHRAKLEVQTAEGFTVSAEATVRFGLDPHALGGQPPEAVEGGVPPALEGAVRRAFARRALADITADRAELERDVHALLERAATGVLVRQVVLGSITPPSEIAGARLALEKQRLELQGLEIAAAAVDLQARITRAQATVDADVRRIEAAATADARRTLADAEAHRRHVVGEAASGTLAQAKSILGETDADVARLLLHAAGFPVEPDEEEEEIEDCH